MYVIKKIQVRLLTQMRFLSARLGMQSTKTNIEIQMYRLIIANRFQILQLKLKVKIVILKN